MTEREQSDRRWREDAERFGWTLPQPAPWPLRLPIIRHVRALFSAWMVARHQSAWASVGALPGGQDAFVLYAMWRGWC